MKPLSSLLALWLLQCATSQAVVYVADPSTLWRPMVGNYDYHADQQTGQPSGDIVGDINGNDGFLTVFNDSGTASDTDGTLGFRVRLDEHGGNNNNPAYTSVLWVGIDADLNGVLDVFLGANFQGNNSQLEIRAPGIGANNSPNTTTISNSTFRTYAIDTIEDATPANYNYRPVNFLNDGGDTNDVTLNTAGDIDYYLSFMVPFADIVQFLGELQSPIQITDKSPLRYVVATSTQVNSLNQDIGGVSGGVSDSRTWVEIGGFTNPVAPVPEPSGSTLLLISLAGGCLIRRRG